MAALSRSDVASRASFSASSLEGFSPSSAAKVALIFVRIVALAKRLRARLFKLCLFLLAAEAWLAIFVQFYPYNLRVLEHLFKNTGLNSWGNLFPISHDRRQGAQTSLIILESPASPGFR